jgi:hypothetical protein
MRKWLVSLTFALPLLAQSEADFRNIFDAYNRALRGELYNPIMAILTEEQIYLYGRVPPEQRRAFFGMTYRIPSSYEVEYLKVSKDGLKARMLVLCSYETHDKAEMTLQFAKQHDFWRMDRPTYGGDPDKRAKPADLSTGAHGDYSGPTTKIRGTVLRLNKQDNGTVYLVRNGEEDDAVFVPKAKVSEDFVPGAVISFHASPHKSEKLKYWAESATLDE